MLAGKTLWHETIVTFYLQHHQRVAIQSEAPAASLPRPAAGLLLCKARYCGGSSSDTASEAVL